MDQLMSCPGLYHIIESVLLDNLTLSDLAQVEQVSLSWSNFIVHQELWKKKLFRCIAPKESYKRLLVELKTFDNEDMYEKSRFYRHLAWRLDQGLIVKEWKFKPIKVRFFSNAKSVRALRLLDKEFIFTRNSDLCFADRRSCINTYQSTDDSSNNEARNVVGGLIETNVLSGHRREVCCFDLTNDLIVTGGRDRVLRFWTRIEPNKCAHEQIEAHSRLITQIKIKDWNVVSSSRDRLLKIWQVQKLDEDQYIVQLKQQLTLHSYSVWTTDMSSDYLVSGSSDKSLCVWKQSEKGWQSHELFRDLSASNGFRHVRILQCSPILAISGDTFGGLKVWNLEEKLLQYEVPEEEDADWFRHAGAVYAIDEAFHEEQKQGFIAVAFGNNRIVLYFTKNVLSGLTVDRVIDLDDYLGPGMIRDISIDLNQIAISHLSDRAGICVLDIW